jgi:alanyl-tRNA synthetase
MPEFVGHDKISCDSKVLVLVKDGEENQEVTQGQAVEVVTEITPFYG